jgi:hypothetical protein
MCFALVFPFAESRSGAMHPKRSVVMVIAVLPAAAANGCDPAHSGEGQGR